MAADEPADDSTSTACFLDASDDEGFSECHDDSDSDGGRAPARGSEDEEIFLTRLQKNGQQCHSQRKKTARDTNLARKATVLALGQARSRRLQSASGRCRSCTV